ncbi:MAG TPA: DUF6491 family protein [Rhizomicrobium sp.]|jgi:hypothetical protein
MRKLALIVALAMIAAGAAHANPNCLELSRVWSFKALDRKTLIVEDDLHEKFRLDLMGYCPALPYKETLGFRVMGGTGLSCIARGDDVISHDAGMRYRCPVQAIQPYTAEMEKADKAAAAAKASETGQ